MENKITKDEFVLVESDYKADLNSSDVNTKDTNINHKSYFDGASLKVAVKSWITDFYRKNLVLPILRKIN